MSIGVQSTLLCNRPLLHIKRNMATSTPQEAKKALRQSIKTKLSALDSETITRQSAVAQNIILTLPQYNNATRISIYLSMPKAEAETDILVQHALRTGKEVFVPYIYRPQSGPGEAKQRSIIEMLQLRSLAEYEGLGRDSWGIPSLPAEGIESRENAAGGEGLYSAVESGAGLDLIVVPGVAFDHGMNRLGHGAGFYDEFLTRFCKDGRRKKPFLGESARATTVYVHLLTR